MYISFNYRETKVYFTKEILGKCVYMQFTIPESTYIADTFQMIINIFGCAIPYSCNLH